MATEAKMAAGAYELPFVASTSLDPMLEREATVATLQRRRGDIRKALGMGGEAFDWMQPVSLGGHGSFGIAPTSLLLCLQTVSAWGKGRALRTLGEWMSKWVVPQLTASPLDELNWELVDAVRGRVLEGSRDEGQSMACLVNHAIRDFAIETPEFLTAAAGYSETMGRLAETIEDVDRLGGEVVRIDGEEALILVDRPDGKELRRVAAPWLERFGLDEEGAPFVLFEQHWSPERRVSYFQPAVLEGGMSEEERSAMEERVREAAQPLEGFKARVY